MDSTFWSTTSARSPCAPVASWGSNRRRVVGVTEPEFYGGGTNNARGAAHNVEARSGEASLPSAQSIRFYRTPRSSTTHLQRLRSGTFRRRCPRRSARKEYAKHRKSGPVETPLWLGPQGVAATVAKATGVDIDTARKQIVESQGGFATGRFTRPDEVADLVLLLASDRAGKRDRFRLRDRVVRSKHFRAGRGSDESLKVISPTTYSYKVGLEASFNL